MKFELKPKYYILNELEHNFNLHDGIVLQLQQATDKLGNLRRACRLQHR